ncbi:MAG: endo alpha-1,4 polygalactosaminidase [Reichenbachiella sp.]
MVNGKNQIQIALTHLVRESSYWWGGVLMAEACILLRLYFHETDHLMKFIKMSIVVMLTLCLHACDDGETENDFGVDLKEEMRSFVIGISEYGKAADNGFVIIPQNGIELVTQTGDEDAEVHAAYLAAIDGHGQEDLFYGYDSDDTPTPTDDNTYLRTFLDLSLEQGNQILVTDYCATHSNMDDSYLVNNENGYVSFAADERELDQIPVYPATIYGENEGVITDLSEVKNFLYLINPDQYSSKQALITAVTATNYDLIIMDLFFGEVAWTANEISQLRAKANGGSRLVISYMSIGEAEDYRYYWDSDWTSNPPTWMDRENPDWAGNYKVHYWDEEWQEVIYGNEQSYLQKIMDAGFDGVYLDIIDAFEYYE